MTLKISETLEVSLRERNRWLVAAGFAPLFKTRPLDDPQMSQVMSAVRMMLTNHEPFPAVAVDRAWNIRLANPPFERLTAMLGVDIWKSIGGAQREAEASAGEDMRQILTEMCPYQDKSFLWAAEDTALLPVLPLRMARNGVQLSLFAVIATFGTAQDVTADELRIESLFPADEATEQLFRAAASS